MKQKCDILHMIVRLVVTLGLLLRVARMNALEDAQASELGQSQLQFLDGLVTRHILGRVARLSLACLIGRDV